MVRVTEVVIGNDAQVTTRCQDFTLTANFTGPIANIPRYGATGTAAFVTK